MINFLWPGPKPSSLTTTLKKGASGSQLAWPTLTDQSADFWRDHFTGASIDATKWTESSGGGGSLSVASSMATFQTTGTGQHAFIQRAVDPGSAGLYLINLKLSGDINPITLMQASGGYSTGGLTAKLTGTDATDGGRFRAYRASLGAGESWVLERWTSPGTTTRVDWDEVTTDSWVAVGTQSTAVIREDGDFAIIGIEFNGSNQFRFMAWHRNGTTRDNDNSLRMFALTDWQTITSNYDNLYLVIGQPYNDRTGTISTDVEWVHYADGAKTYWWWNERNGTGGNYNIRGGYSYDGGRTIVPHSRTVAISDAKDPCVWYDGSTYYHMIYNKQSATAGIGHATATDPAGTWTANSVANPIVSIPAAHAGVEMPFFVVDNGESDANKRWKLLFSANTAAPIKSLFYATSPAPTGTPPETFTWTTPVNVLTAVAGNEGVGPSNPVAIWNGPDSRFDVWYGSIADQTVDPPGATQQYRTFRATADGGDLGTLTRDGNGIRIDVAANGDALITAISGRTLTLSTVDGFEADAMVVITNDNTAGNFNLSRVRSVSGSDIELYHEIEGYSAGTLTSRVSGTYRWVASGSGTNEYYCELAAGGDPTISGIGTVTENGERMRKWGTLGGLKAGDWGYGDNDTLGFSTIYVRLSDGADPDSKAAGYVSTAPTGDPVIRTWKHASVYPRLLAKVGSEWWLWSTPFSPFRDDPNYDALFESNGLWTQSSSWPENGTFALDQTYTPPIHTDDFGGKNSLENLCTVLTALDR